MATRQLTLATRATSAWPRAAGPIVRRSAIMAVTLPGLVVLVAVGALVGWRGFDGLYGQDAYAYFDYATGPLRQALLSAKVLVPPNFFWPPGYPVLVTLMALVVGPQALAGQLVALLMGGCVPVATALLARELWPNNARRALLAGGLTAVSGQLWQSSAVVMSDTTGLALATFGVWATVRYQRGGAGGWLVLAAALLGWASITRWIYGLVALLAAVHALWAVLRREPARRGARLTRSRGWPARALLLHGLPALVVGGGLVAWVLVPAVSQGAFVGTLETYGSDTWSAANIFKREFLTTGHGFVRYSLPNGVYYAGAPLHPFMLTPLLGLLALPGLAGALRERGRSRGRGQDRGGLLLLLGWIGAMYLFHAGTTWQNLRYVLAYLPPVAVLAGVGADVLLERFPRAVGVGLVAGVCWAVAGGVILTDQFIDRKQADLAMVRWVDAQLPPGAELLTFGPTLTFRHYSQRPTLELFELSPADLTRLQGRPAYLLLDVGNVEEQWAGRAPAEDYHWLRDGPGLSPLGTIENLTLFRIGRG